MKTLIAIFLTSALLAPASAALAEPGDLSAAFDGARPKTSLDTSRFRLKVLHPVSDKGGQVPEDIKEASKTWGNEAQFNKLRGAQPQNKETFSFAVLGDVEPGRFPWQRVFTPKGAFGKLMSLIHARNPDFILQLGDFVSKGTVMNYREYISLLEKIVSLPLLTVIGNHDRPAPNDTDGDKTLYRALFGKTDYFYDYNGWRFIALDTANRKLADPQLEWLKAALETGNRKLIFTHIPPIYLKNKIQMVEPDSDEGLSPQDYDMSGYFDEGSAEFERLITAAGVSRVYMGHIHAYGTADRKGIRYVLSGGGGSPLYPLPPGYPKLKFAHFVLVTLGPTGVEDRVFKADGTELTAGVP